MIIKHSEAVVSVVKEDDMPNWAKVVQSAAAKPLDEKNDSENKKIAEETVSEEEDSK